MKLKTLLSAIFAILLLSFAVPCGAQVSVAKDNAADSAVNNSPGTEASASSLVIHGEPNNSGSATPVPAVVAPADASTPDGPWHLSVSPYLWFPGVHGGLGFNNTEVVGIHATPGDLLSHFKFGLMGVVEPSYKRIVMPLDVFWVRLGDDRAFTNLGTVAKVTGNQFILTQKVGYRLIDRKAVKVDALAGFRYWHFGTGVKFSTNTLNFSGSQNWVDPLVGGRITGNLSPKVSVIVAGDVGGWGAGSQLDYQIVGALGYRIKPAVVAQIGYRYLAVNYRNNGQFATRFADVVTSGALTGVTFNLK